MKTVTTRQDAIEKAYAAGVICQFGSLTIEGVGFRKTNWGRGISISIHGPSKGLSKDSLEWFVTPSNHDKNAIHSWSGQTYKVLLTTFKEANRLFQALGLDTLIAETLDICDFHDKLSAVGQAQPIMNERVIERMDSIAVQRMLKDCETDIEIAVISELECIASFDSLHQAFLLGKSGLTPMQEEIERMVAA